MTGQKAALADPRPARNSDMARDESVIADHAMMTDVTPAPNDNIVAYARVRIDEVRANKAMLSDFIAVKPAVRMNE